MSATLSGSTPPGAGTAGAAHRSAKLPIGASILGQRLLAAAFAVWAAVTIVFVMITATGDPALALAPEDASAAQVALIRARYGFDQPIFVQYVRFFIDLVTGGFPSSLYSRQSAIDVVLGALPNTLKLGGAGIAVGILLGGTIGYAAVFGRSRLARDVPIAILMVVQSIPGFLIGIVLILLFALQLRWLPTSGARSSMSIILPALTVGLSLAPAIARLLRSALMEQLSADYVNTARAKGLTRRQVRLRHILGNSLVPVVTLVGLQAGSLLSGIVVVETVFAWPGLGSQLVKSVNLHDYPVVVTAVVVVAVAYVTLSLLVDILVMILNPRSRR